MHIVSFRFSEGKYFASVDSSKEFLVGRRVHYDNRTRRGLENLVGNERQRYQRQDFKTEFGFWADFMEVVAAGEGGLYHTLNTYDRARFTFGFLQYAAHVPNGDFVVYLRRLLELPPAKDYFPDLSLINGRICRTKDGQVQPLEGDTSTSALQQYFNPTSESVEDVEVIQAAKMIHWVQNDPDHQRLQVVLGVEHFRDNMKSYSARYKLDRRSDVECILVADIRHQGRGGHDSIKAALSSARPVERLLEIGAQAYPSRITTLKATIKRLTADGALGAFVYSDAKADFVPKQ